MWPVAGREDNAASSPAIGSGMPFHDLRDFLDHLSGQGELLGIDARVEPELESTALSLRALRESGPALLMNNAGSAHPLLGNLFGHRRRIEMALDGRPLASLREHYTNARQARLRDESIEKDLQQGHWETDAAVEERHLLMQATVGGQQLQLDQRKASNAAAGIAVGNARERYIDVLRATVRRYRKNIVDLGQLAGVEVNADLPHLENDDTVLRQAELSTENGALR